ncbi:wd40 repeat-containing protein [Stylonychia lemnae]|uniref:Wd40 repeat-containing protein n=1 Tax=Stylonychia lemnae TaxID=5949 RepID=A0A078A3H0_STYLE|nr:wd40 repeat-containing protein [Stylonychia lemnae]|eukprot:CDW76342.1 wd40 repeat-containing protein [Stylonychia lemnae]
MNSNSKSNSRSVSRNTVTKPAKRTNTIQFSTAKKDTAKSNTMKTPEKFNTSRKSQSPFERAQTSTMKSEDLKQLQINSVMNVVQEPHQSMRPEGEMDLTLGSPTNEAQMNMDSSLDNSLTSPQKNQKEEIEGTNQPFNRDSSMSSLLENSSLKVRLNLVPKENPICNLHPELKQSLYCRNCEKKLCEKCFRDPKHQDHQFEQIDKFVEFKKASWSDYFQEQRLRIRNIMQGVDYISWGTLDQELKQLVTDPFYKQKELLINIEEFENSIAKLINQHNIKQLINYDNRKDYIARVIYDFNQDILNFKQVSYFYKKQQESAHLIDMEQQLKDLVNTEMENFRSFNKQELEYATNKIIYLEQEIIPQIEQLPKYNSNDDLQELKKSQNEIVKTIEGLLKMKQQLQKDQTSIQQLNNQFKDFVFEFEKLRTQSSEVEGKFKQTLKKTQVDIDKEQNQKINDLNKKILDLEAVVNQKLSSQIVEFQRDSQTSQKYLEKKINEIQELMLAKNSEVSDKQQIEFLQFDSQIQSIQIIVDQKIQSLNEKLKEQEIDIESLKDHSTILKQRQEQLVNHHSDTQIGLKKLESDLELYMKSERERRVRNWDLDSGEEAEIQTQHNNQTLIMLSNQLVVVAQHIPLGNKQYLNIYDTDSDYEQAGSIQTFHTGFISCMAEHNKMLLTGSYDQMIGLWDIYNGFQLLQKYAQGNEEALTCILSIDNRYFMSSCNQGSLKIWDSVNHSLACNKSHQHKQKINNIQIISKYRVISSSNDKFATIWQLQGANMSKVYELPHNSFVVSAQQLSTQDEDLILTCTMQGYLSIWNLDYILQQASSQQKFVPSPIKQFKLDSNQSLIQSQLIQDYNYKLYPFLLLKTIIEVHIIQITTGKHFKAQIKLDLEAKKNKSGELEKFAEMKKCIQIDQQHLMVIDGDRIKVIAIEITNLKDVLL